MTSLFLLSRRSFLATCALFSSLPKLQAQEREHPSFSLTATPPSLLQPDATYQGTFPGPLLRIKAKELLDLTLKNQLDQPIDLQICGISNLPLPFNPLSSPPLPKGASRLYQFPSLDPGLYLYQASAFSAPWLRAWKGLSGLLVVEEPTPPDVDLEHMIYVHDGPLKAQEMKVPSRARLRMRIANLSRTTFQRLKLEGLRPYILAIDSQPCDVFEPLRHEIPLNPCARFDLLCDLDPLHKNPRALLMGEKPFPLVTFMPQQPPSPLKADPKPLPLTSKLPTHIPLAQALHLDLKLTPDSINGRKGDHQNPPLFSIKHGSSVHLRLINISNEPLCLHLHGHAARPLHLLDDGWEPYWRDTFFLLPGRSFPCAFIAHHIGTWLLESTNPLHTQAGLWGFFKVTE